MVKTQEASDYEKSREKRIKENRERMQQLGILDLSLQVKSLKPSPKRNVNRKNQQRCSPVPSSAVPMRRSSRLQNSTPVSYCEVPVPKKEKSLANLLREEGAKPEIYTEEHVKLLGSTEMEWTLFVDGYGRDGKKVYDSINGKTCHQCRQKTLGQRTHCYKCNLVQGQFCGDCLYMRYGENVLEANANPEWTCPVCRGICNCSLCRQAKGWAPTGPLYRKISRLGYKSVAHYLIQTRLASTDSGENHLSSKAPTSAKRVLPFSDTDAKNGENDIFESNHEESVKEEKDSNEKHGVFKYNTESEIEHPFVEPDIVTMQLEDESKQFSNPKKEQIGSVDEQASDSSILTKSGHHIEKTTSIEVLGKEGNGDKETTDEDGAITELDEQDFLAAQERRARSSAKGKKRKIFEPPTDSIAARLRQRLGKQ